MLKINDHIITTDILYPIEAWTPGTIVDIIEYEVVDPILYTTSYEKEYLIDTGTMITRAKSTDITIDTQYYREQKINQIIHD
jgi:hypothetical protein